MEADADTHARSREVKCLLVSPPEVPNATSHSLSAARASASDATFAAMHDPDEASMHFALREACSKRTTREKPQDPLCAAQDGDAAAEAGSAEWAPQVITMTSVAPDRLKSL
jgi:hypothetical protein